MLLEPAGHPRQLGRTRCGARSAHSHDRIHVTITEWSPVSHPGPLGRSVVPSRTVCLGGDMTNPYTAPPVPQPTRPAPRWARKRYLLPALGLALFIGVGIGAGGETTTTRAKPTAADPRPTVTVTATATVTRTSEPEPAPTVTATKTVKATRTVTARPATAGGDDSGGDGSGGDGSAGQDVYYANCSEVRAAGAAPIHRGEPGYASHLDRDNDGVACDT
ncbi:hypothetical protein GCM10027072_56560 [Streptomyces bullii]